ncbi:MAG: hypothetical protein EBT98_10835 [Opitutaceae bacterium]|nr:hypothetical protein [Opitutaceae bacterium]
MVSSPLFLTAGWRAWMRFLCVGFFAGLVVVARAADDKIPTAGTVLYPRSAGVPAESTPGHSTNYATGRIELLTPLTGPTAPPAL